MSKPSYKVEWVEDLQSYLATCSAHSDLSWADSDPLVAMTGLKVLVDQAVGAPEAERERISEATLMVMRSHSDDFEATLRLVAEVRRLRHLEDMLIRLGRARLELEGHKTSDKVDHGAFFATGSRHANLQRAVEQEAIDLALSAERSGRDSEVPD